MCADARRWHLSSRRRVRRQLGASETKARRTMRRTTMALSKARDARATQTQTRTLWRRLAAARIALRSGAPPACSSSSPSRSTSRTSKTHGGGQFRHCLRARTRPWTTRHPILRFKPYRDPKTSRASADRELAATTRVVRLQCAKTRPAKFLNDNDTDLDQA